MTIRHEVNLNSNTSDINNNTDSRVWEQLIKRSDKCFKYITNIYIKVLPHGSTIYQVHIRLIVRRNILNLFNTP